LVLAVLFFAGLGFLTLAVIWATSPRAPISLRPADLLASQDGRVARVVATANGRCQQSTFDNDTAYVSNVGTPCSSHDGEPVPAGTARRLDAISRSFYGRD
jgi:hypothetical protein